MVEVMTKWLLCTILAKHDLSKRVMWLVELNEFSIRYVPPLTIKAHVLCKFLAGSMGELYLGMTMTQLEKIGCYIWTDHRLTTLQESTYA